MASGPHTCKALYYYSSHYLHRGGGGGGGQNINSGDNVFVYEEMDTF